MLSSSPNLFQIFEQPTDVMVGMFHESRKHFHHPRVQFLLVRRQLVPIRNIRIVTRKLGVFGHDAQFLLAFEDSFAIGVPAVVELSLVFVGPLLGHLMRRVVCAGGEIQEERLVRRHLLGVPNELDRLVDEVFGQMVALLRRLRRLDLVVVIDQIGIVLVSVAAEETVVTLEAASQRPAIVRSRRAGLFGGSQVPFAHRVRVVPVHQEDFGEESILKRDDAVGSRIASRSFRDTGHAIRMMIAAR